MLGGGHGPYGRLTERVGADPIGKKRPVAPTLYRNTGYSLSHLVEDIKVGRIGLPDIQRPFVWSSAKTRDLLDSMYRGYPIGTLMFWETGAEVGTRQIGTAETGRTSTPQLLVVDGQQRLTSLFAVITGQLVLTKTFEEKRIRIAFRPGDERFEVADAAIDRDPEFIPDITELWYTRYNPTVRAFLRRLVESQDPTWTTAVRTSWRSGSTGSATCATSRSRSSSSGRPPRKTRSPRSSCGSTPKGSNSSRPTSSSL